MRLFAAAALLLPHLQAAAAAAAAVGQRLVRHDAAGGTTTTVEAWGADSVRVRVHAGALIPVPAAQALLPSATPPPGTPPHPAALTESSLTNGNIAVAVSAAGLVTVTRVSDKKVLLKQTAQSLTPPPTDPATPTPASSAETPRPAAFADGAGLSCTTLPDTDLDPNDHDLSHKPAANPAACAASCLADTSCYAFTFTDTNPPKTCFHKGPQVYETKTTPHFLPNRTIPLSVRRRRTPRSVCTRPATPPASAARRRLRRRRRRTCGPAPPTSPSKGWPRCVSR
eukprot:COSAG04_NODE_1212_length_7719_cov_26.278346_4_plen_283_part_00